MERNKQHELARAIAKELGWETIPAPNWGDPAEAPLLLKGPEGESLWIGSEWNKKDKVHISADFPTGRDGSRLTEYNATKPEISVSISRGPVVIAKEIKRRLFPDLYAQWEGVKKRLEDSNSFFDGRKNTLETIKGILGPYVAPGGYHQNITEESLGFQSTTGFYGDIEPSNKSTTLHMRSVPNELAFAVCQLVRDWADKKK